MFSLRDLECFMAVVEHQTFTRAAAALNIAQPPLSRRIADLEQQVGADLFVRGSRLHKLTDAGVALVREARLLLQQAQIAERVVKETLSGQKGHLRIGFTAGSTGFAMMPRAVRAFREAHAHVDVKLAYFVITHQSDALRFGLVDVAVVGGLVDAEGFRVDRVATNQLVVALPADHPLAVKDAIALADLAGEPFIEFPRYGPTGLHDLVRSLFAREGFVPRIVQEAEGHDVVVTCVASGLGLALVNETAAQLPITGVVYRRLIPDAPAIPLVALSRSGDQNPSIPAFVDILRAVAAAS
jgi:DNA-binding transcriptional LysR family regulator